MKDALRQKMREKRKTISPALHAKKSSQICERALKLPEYLEAEDVLFYVSTQSEVETHKLIKNALKSDKAIYAPRIEGRQIVVCRIHDWKDLEPGVFSILEPKEYCEPVHPRMIDLIFVPGLAFDSRGHRLGNGRAFFDGLLATTDAYKVGLAFEEQVIDFVPNEPHDIPVDLIITDQNLITI